jgi:hypothetical protein
LTFLSGNSVRFSAYTEGAELLHRPVSAVSEYPHSPKNDIASRELYYEGNAILYSALPPVHRSGQESGEPGIFGSCFGVIDESPGRAYIPPP